MLRGEVYQANLDPIAGSEQGGTRPVLIVSRDALNVNAPIVIVVPLTGRENKRRLYPTHVELTAGESGLTKNSVVLCEQVRAISKDRLTKKIGQVSPQRMSFVDAALKIFWKPGMITPVCGSRGGTGQRAQGLLPSKFTSPMRKRTAPCSSALKS